MSQRDSPSPVAKPDLITVALAANHHYFAGLAATIVSLLRSNRRNHFDVHIIDGGLSGFQKKFLTRKVTQTASENRIQFHALNAARFAGFKLDYGNSYMTYARILIGSLVNTDRVIYFDCDLIVAADVRPLWEAALGGNIAAACQDPTIPRLKDDYPFDDTCADAPYFNAGVMVINLDAWRRTGVQEQILALIAKAPERFRWWDQTAMNVLFQNRIHFLDRSWNTFAEEFDPARRDEGGIFHFAGKAKPWTKYLDSVEFELWRTFFARHVLSRTYLLRNGNYRLTYAQFRRHQLLHRSRILQRIAIGVLRAQARLGGNADSSKEERFRKRHTPGANPDRRARAARRTAVAEYVTTHWGAA